MNGLLVVLVILMVIFIIMLVAMVISIIKLTHQIRQTQQAVETITGRVSDFSGIISAVSIGAGLAKRLTSKGGFLAKYFTKKRTNNGRKNSQKTTR